VNTQYSPWSLLALLPIFVWELSLGLWLTFKGFRSGSPVLARTVGAEASAPAPRPAVANPAAVEAGAS